MWDLTIPANHDFYIATTAADILVHHCDGGVYTLRNPETGDVVRTGRTGNLAVREAQHVRDPILGDLEFHVEFRTDNYEEQQGLEQALYGRYPTSQEANSGLNKIRAISLSNPMLLAGPADAVERRSRRLVRWCGEIIREDAHVRSVAHDT